VSNSVDVKRYLSEGWDMFKNNMTNLLVANIILVVLILGASLIPFGGVVVSGPLMGGMFYLLIDINTGEPFSLKRLFDGFTQNAVPLILAGLGVGIITSIGFVLLFLPGVVFAGWYLFTYLYVVDRDMDFWGAMEASRAVAFENHIGIFLLALALSLVNLVGALIVGIGLLVTMPFSFCVVYVAYAELVGVVSDSRSTVGAGGRVMSEKPRVKVEPPPPPKENGKK